MPLPILQSSHHNPTPADLIRFYMQTERDWTRHTSEETTLDVGTAFHNAELDRVWDANNVIDAAIPEGMSPVDAVAQVDEHFASNGSRCRRWNINPSAPPERTRPLVDHLLSLGWRTLSCDVMYLAGSPTGTIREVGGLKIIPARASYRHARELAGESSKRWNEPQLVEAAILHFEDPHFDALLALKDGEAVAMAGVLAVGEIGRVDEVFVSEKYRRLGIGRTMMSRVLEVCARSLFRHVLLSCLADNAAAVALYGSIGFRRVGTIESYVPADTSA
jgi:ribosomal protein S18 acetylase RimI-like enzyme